MSMGGRARFWLLRIAAVAVGFLLSLLVAEVALRILGIVYPVVWQGGVEYSRA
jgi:hypothetical protein